MSEDPEWLYGYGILCHQRGLTTADDPCEATVRTGHGNSQRPKKEKATRNTAYTALYGGTHDMPARGKLKWLMARTSNHSPSRSPRWQLDMSVLKHKIRDLRCRDTVCRYILCRYYVAVMEVCQHLLQHVKPCRCRCLFRRGLTLQCCRAVPVAVTVVPFPVRCCPCRHPFT